MSASTFTSKMAHFLGKSDATMDRAFGAMAIDIDRLSKMQVPHDKGGLQNSGEVKRLGLKKFQVAYNKPYARRWEFETPRNGFKKGRKSRYLRDPAELIIKRAHQYIKEASRAEGLK